jgi:arabinan endo-1,5-alpha-L-arabinosidase
MYMNSQNWPVVAPHRFAHLQPMYEVIYQQEVPGTYMFINHGKTISSQVKTSQRITLNANGTISGQQSGSWQYTGNNRAVIQLGGQTYHGVFSREWNETVGTFVVTFSAQSSGGVSVWGSRLVQ